MIYCLSKKLFKWLDEQTYDSSVSYILLLYKSTDVLLNYDVFYLFLFFLVKALHQHSLVLLKKFY